MRTGIRVDAFGALLLALLSAAAWSRPADGPVVDAARRGDIGALRELIRQGADVNEAEGDGMTPLHWAAHRGDAKMAELLIYAGANPEVGTRIGLYTPLHVASRSGSAAVARVLLEAGSDVNAVTTNSGATALHFAAAVGNPELVALLLDHGADPNAREARWDQTPLVFAAANNRAEAIRVLLNRGADPDATSRVVDISDRARVDEAARERGQEVLEAFRGEEGGQPQAWQPTPGQLRVAELAAREVQRAGVAGLEDEDAEADADGEDGSEEGEGQDEEEEEEDEYAYIIDYQDQVGSWGGLTALLHAARQGHEEAAIALLDGGADIDAVSAGDRTGPLLMATINGQFDLALLLLERGADPELANSAGNTPLYAAIDRRWAPRTRFPQPRDLEAQQASHLDVMKALLEAGVDPDVRLEKHLYYMGYFDCGNFNCGLEVVWGATPFWRAAYGLDLEAMRLLVAYGADSVLPTRKPPERRRGDDEDEEEDEEEDPSGLPPIPTGGPGVYPIHAASGVGYGEGFAANAHEHVPGGWLPAVRYLVEELGADVNARDFNGYNAVHHAAARGDNELILYLVEQGADVTAVARTGQTTADMANGPVQRISPFPATVELLESLGSRNNHNCVSC